MKRHFAVAIVSALSWAAFSLAADEKDLNGAWVATGAMQDGQKVPDDFVKGASLAFADGKYTSSLGEITEEGTFKVDRSKKPNTLDLSPKAGKRRIPARPAIFELNGDTLRICWNLTTKQRPKDFTSTAENKQFVVVYTRKK